VIGLLFFVALGSGCCAVPVSVGNPIPGMTTIAVAPFFNLSAEPSVDGRRFALAYYSELQKTANYQVIPVGVVESAIRENDLDMSSSADAVKLAQILDADAVVVGAVTDYSPYYPPQLAVHVRWYSPREWMFYPGISTGDEKDRGLDKCPIPDVPGPEGKKQAPPVIRGQSTDESTPPWVQSSPAESPTIQLAQSQASAGTPNPALAPPPVWPPVYDTGDGWSGGTERPVPGKSNGAFTLQMQPNAAQPIMAYTRSFDGADRELIQALKGYYVLRGDMRSGGWEAYLHRSDDFLRFASHVLVVEMLTLHGGPLKTEKIFLYGR
jgi:hypothetical protein